jgi:hypothetical protein
MVGDVDSNCRHNAMYLSYGCKDTTNIPIFQGFRGKNIGLSQ